MRNVPVSDHERSGSIYELRGLMVATVQFRFMIRGGFGSGFVVLILR